MKNTQTLFGTKMNSRAATANIKKRREAGRVKGQRKGQPRAVAASKIKARKKLNQFAEGLSLGMSVHEAAVFAGQRPRTGENMLTKLRRELGWQAQ